MIVVLDDISRYSKDAPSMRRNMPGDKGYRRRIEEDKYSTLINQSEIIVTKSDFSLVMKCPLVDF